MATAKNGVVANMGTHNSATNGRLGAQVPINWEPPVNASERFSHRLNLTDAFIDMKKQTLTCPHQHHLEVVASDGVEERELQRLVWSQTGQKNGTVAVQRKLRLGFLLLKGDYIYMVSEPPGEPYYIGRVMGFNEKSKPQAANGALMDVSATHEFLIQWFYRPRDISKNTLDLRLLFASMHSDTCPLTSFRGLVTVKHKQEVEKLYVPKLHSSVADTVSAVEYYTLLPNCFYFDKLFDRYMIKFYDIVRTASLLEYLDNNANNNRNYILALNKRYEYVFMEATRTKTFLNNFTSTMSTHCTVCAEWCPSSASVTCSGCGKHFHMLCLDPPLLKKPSRGFSWTCALCSKQHDLEQQRKKIVMLLNDNKTAEFHASPEMEFEVAPESAQEDSPYNLAASCERSLDDILPKYELAAMEYLRSDADKFVAERRLAEEWNIRYLGLHCKLEDAVDPDDRSPYPRASTSLGARYQATNIPEYIDHPIMYYEVENVSPHGKSKKGPGGRKANKRATDEEKRATLLVPSEFRSVLPKNYPSWLQPRPKGYLERGVDDGCGNTCTLLWKARAADIDDDFHQFDAYLARCSLFAKNLELYPNSPNFMDAIVKIYMNAGGSVENALAGVKKLTRKSLGEPTLTKEEIKRFEAGVKKYGSELYPIAKEVKTQPFSSIVRYYYVWKKTKRGQTIWGKYPGRKKKNKASEMKVITAGDAFADSDDDSAYENEKIVEQKKLFKCKHCHLYVSEAWYKITGFDGASKHDSGLEVTDPHAVTALCFRCAKLWRRYAVYWEDPLEVDKKNTKGVGGYKRKVEAELADDAERILTHADMIGAVLCPEPHRSTIESSVICDSALFREPLKYLTKQKPAELVVQSKPASRLTLRQATLSAKDQSPEPQRKKRKTEKRTEKKVYVKEEIKKETVDKKESKIETIMDTKVETVIKDERKRATNRKESAAKRKKKETKADTKVKKEHSATPKPATKRPKEAAYSQASAISPLFNSLYSTPLSLRSLMKMLLTTPLLKQVIDSFCSAQSVNPILLAGSKKVISELCPVQACATCAVCLEGITSNETSSDSLFCITCRVSVHSSCVAESNDSLWQCECCMNEINANFSRNYTCCLCTTGYEGHQRLGPAKDYFVCVSQTGQWCHILCAIFSCVSFGVNGIPASLDAKSSIYSGVFVENVALALMRNTRSICTVCSVAGGCLIECMECGADTRAHVSCAQRADGFCLGFYLTLSASKTGANAFVEGEACRITPIMVCAKHECPANVLPIRHPGKKLPNADPRTLLFLFLEDLRRTTRRGGNGALLQSSNYLTMVAECMDQRDGEFDKLKHGQLTENTAMKGKHTRCCARCNVFSSPRWWPQETTVSIEEQDGSGLKAWLSQQSREGEFASGGNSEPVMSSEGEVASEIICPMIKSVIQSRVIQGSGEPGSLSLVNINLEKARGGTELESDIQLAKEAENGSVFSEKRSNDAQIEKAFQRATSSMCFSPMAIAKSQQQYLCQKCHLSSEPLEYEAHGTEFLAEITQPLQCLHLGLTCFDDRVTSVYKFLSA